MFQSTRPRGRTRPSFSMTAISFPCFNPRVLAGGRDSIGHASGSRSCFNPRVLAGGRDLAFLSCVSACRFQSTRPRGRTRRRFGGSSVRHIVFQSTRPRGRTRPGTPATVTPPTGFNPRVLAGGRDNTKTPWSLNRTFQSTRPRGRTRHAACASFCCVWFQSTRPRGRTRRKLSNISAA